MGCSDEENQALQFLPQQLQQAGSGELMFFVQGVKVGLQIHAAEQAKWTRLGWILALTFGTLTFLKHFSASDD